MSTLVTSHIRIDDRGVAWVDDTNIKVIEVALDQLAHGSSPEEIFRQHDGYLTLGQIHSALSHYYDNREEFDREIERQLEEFDRARASNVDSPTLSKLRRLGRRP